MARELPPHIRRVPDLPPQKKAAAVVPTIEPAAAPAGKLTDKAKRAAAKVGDELRSAGTTAKGALGTNFGKEASWVAKSGRAAGALGGAGLMAHSIAKKEGSTLDRTAEFTAGAAVTTGSLLANRGNLTKLLNVIKGARGR